MASIVDDAEERVEEMLDNQLGKIMNYVESIDEENHTQNYAIVEDLKEFLDTYEEEMEFYAEVKNRADDDIVVEANGMMRVMTESDYEEIYSKELDEETLSKEDEYEVEYR